MHVRGDADRHVRADDLAGPSDDLAVGVGVLLGDGGAVLGHQDAVPGALILQERHHLADDTVEGVFGDGADRAGDGEEERHDLEAEALAGGKHAGHARGGSLVLLADLVASQDLPHVVGGRHPGEGVRLVSEPERRQSHSLIPPHAYTGW